jgi:hypothetical protein
MVGFTGHAHSLVSASYCYVTGDFWIGSKLQLLTTGIHLYLSDVPFVCTVNTQRDKIYIYIYIYI